MTPRGGGAVYPFSAVVGQEELRLALVLLAVDPGVGGVLVRGQKGTAKTTTVRGLASLVPADGSGRGHAPFVELPLGATEDRVVGSLDLDELVDSGRPVFRPGLLGAADGGLLYVDEVNLLADHLVDVLLDSAASGRLTVERDGVSHTSSARFGLVGTMNPEEGELRPQLLDRFGLAVDVRGPADAAERVEVVRRRRAFDADPEGFAARHAAADAEISERIGRARRVLPSVRLPERELLRISLVCLEVGVEGMRADVVTARAAVAHAAWEGRDAVCERDVRAAAMLALPHRRRRDPFDPAEMDPEELERALEEARRRLDDEPEPDPPGPDGPDDSDPDGTGPDDTGRDGSGEADPGDGGPGGDGPAGAGGPDRTDPPRGQGSDDASGGPHGDDRVGGPTGAATDDATRPEDGAADAADGPAPVGVAVRPDVSRSAGRVMRFSVSGSGRGASGRRSAAETVSGRLVPAPRPGAGASRPEAGTPRVLHLLDTARAAALRRARGGGAVPAAGSAGTGLESSDLRWGRRLGREGNLVVFLVDTSGSMAARRRLDAVTGSCVALLRDAYVRRDLVAVVEAHGDAASVAVPPTRSVEVAVRRLSAVDTGGRTPLAEGFAEVRGLLARHRMREPERRVVLVLLTDGRATHGADAPARARAAARAVARTPGVASLVVDCESGRVRLGGARELARELGAPVLSLDELGDDTVARVLRAA